MTIEALFARDAHSLHVDGKLKPGLDAMAVLKATFPAGTVSGAPKVRAMEIIDELEPAKRGIYAVPFGYLGFNGDSGSRDSDPHRGGEGWHAGMCRPEAGIVADSVPKNEWVETQQGARMLRAAEMAKRV